MYLFIFGFFLLVFVFFIAYASIYIHISSIFDKDPFRRQSPKKDFAKNNIVVSVFSGVHIRIF